MHYQSNNAGKMENRNIILYSITWIGLPVKQFPAPHFKGHVRIETFLWNYFSSEDLSPRIL